MPSWTCEASKLFRGRSSNNVERHPPMTDNIQLSQNLLDIHTTAQRFYNMDRRLPDLPREAVRCTHQGGRRLKPPPKPLDLRDVNVSASSSGYYFDQNDRGPGYEGLGTSYLQRVMSYADSPSTRNNRFPEPSSARSWVTFCEPRPPPSPPLPVRRTPPRRNPRLPPADYLKDKEKYNRDAIALYGTIPPEWVQYTHAHDINRI